jgi:hypothetical protein
MPAGAYDLRVTDPFGRDSTLEYAYTVEPSSAEIVMTCIAGCFACVDPEADEHAAE